MWCLLLFASGAWNGFLKESVLYWLLHEQRNGNAWCSNTTVGNTSTNVGGVGVLILALLWLDYQMLMRSWGSFHAHKTTYHWVNLSLLTCRAWRGPSPNAWRHPIQRHFVWNVVSKWIVFHVFLEKGKTWKFKRQTVDRENLATSWYDHDV